jgi:hypothetical protein
MRSYDEIRAAEAELSDRRWYIAGSLVGEQERAEQGAMQPEVLEVAAPRRRDLEDRYGLDHLRVRSDYELGLLDGKHAALRWVLGEAWDNLQTRLPG